MFSQKFTGDSEEGPDSIMSSAMYPEDEDQNFGKFLPDYANYIPHDNLQRHKLSLTTDLLSVLLCPSVPFVADFAYRYSEI